MSTPHFEKESVTRTDESGQRYGQDEFGEYKIDDRVWTMNEIRDHPMFMEDVPQDISENPYLLALQNIVYDGQTMEQMAEHFKKLGNEAFRQEATKIANQNSLMAYSKGLEMECKDNVLNATLHSNRAAVSLRVKAYDKAVDDCRQAVKLDPSNNKAFFRGAKASEALKLTSQAIAFAEGCLKLKPEDKEVQTLMARLKRQLAAEDKARKEQLAKEELDRAELASFDGSLRAMLQTRDVQVEGQLFDISMYRSQSRCLPTIASDDKSAVVWPVLFLYDETCQSDFVGDFDERNSLEQMLQMMFPEDRHAEWDREGKYVWDKLSVYLDVHDDTAEKSHLVHINTEEPLQGQLSGHRVSPVLVTHVHVRGSEAEKVFINTNNVL